VRGSYTVRACRKEYMKKWREDNKDKIAANTKSYRENNKEEILAKKKKYRQDNKESIAAYGKRNRGLCNARDAKRRACKLQATPLWFEQERATIRLMYEYATLMQAHVDHIVPLQNSKVCGLHTLNNLQLLTAEDNLTKSNKYSY
jgi:hypothetical protein